ncbi:HK97 gp10 family phage protein [Pseudooceanicola nanhaiensis]|uniref:HK97 gp10 family phage protein n=1 Tax=Pseudooceanicola nanhaiensis TaxID=375761 RepID=UPI001CD49755|nr:HK97 gp10 family phage protein [Pseudooceanicola nanhaiensis]MCA0923002.1 HK97 gp10 family phage protein [Pseudooceanicola nanhaiensis]
MKTRVSLEGFAELEAQLEKMTKATGRAALRRAGISALEPMARLARGLAPEETGDLIESVEVSAKAIGAAADVGKRAFAQVMRDGGTRGEAASALRSARRAAHLGGAAPHVELFMGPEKASSKDEAIKAWVQEFGSADVDPTPYMRPAWDQDKDNMLARLKEDLWFEIATAVERTQARARKTAGLE